MDPDVSIKHRIKFIAAVQHWVEAGRKRNKQRMKRRRRESRMKSQTGTMINYLNLQKLKETEVMCFSSKGNYLHIIAMSFRI